MSFNRINFRLIRNPFGLLLRLFYLALLIEAIRPYNIINQGIQPLVLPDECPNNPIVNITNAKEFLLYPNESKITATNLTNIDKFCTRKTKGRSKGRICCWNNNWSYMKHEFNDMRLLEYYQGEFARNNLNASVPLSKFVYLDNQLLLSALNVKGFVSAQTYYGSPFNETHFREIITAVVGETNIPKVFAVSTWINDIGLENWGYDKETGKLIFIDVDGGKNTTENFTLQPKTLQGYLDLARNMIWHDSTSMSLSLRNIHDLRAIYKNMMLINPPVIHPAVDMDIKLYQTILSYYIDFCEKAISIIKHENANVTDDYHDHHHNEIIGWQINEMMNQLQVTGAASIANKFEEVARDAKHEVAAGPTSMIPHFNNDRRHSKDLLFTMTNAIIPITAMLMMMSMLIAALMMRRKPKAAVVTGTHSETQTFFRRPRAAASNTTSRAVVIKIAR